MYVILQPFLKRIFPGAALNLFDSEKDDFIRECIFVLLEVRRIASELEDDRRATESRSRRLLKEFLRHFVSYSSSREERPHASDTIGNAKKTLPSIDINLQKVRQRVFQSSSIRFLSMNLSGYIHRRILHLETPVFRAKVFSILQNADNEAMWNDSR